MNIKVSILMSVYDGAVWLPAVLDSIKEQTYTHDRFEVLILDNASTDKTTSIIENWKLRIENCSLLKSNENIGFWAGFEKLLSSARGEYVIALTDIILEQHFMERAVAVMDANKTIGAIQAKILQIDGKHIDTVGFQIERSRRVTNRGQGEIDNGQYDRQEEIFAVEGAVPIFRRSSVEDCRIDGHFSDPSYRVGPYSYGDDFDNPWRMHLFGWKQMYVPSVIAYHDRSTTHNISHSFGEYLGRIAPRRKIPLAKRRLDWSNIRFTIIKNDYIINILRDLPRIAFRELMVLGYAILFEPAILKELPRFFRLLPSMLKKRRLIMQRAKINADGMRRWLV